MFLVVQCLPIWISLELSVSAWKCRNHECSRSNIVVNSLRIFSIELSNLARFFFLLMRALEGDHFVDSIESFGVTLLWMQKCCFLVVLLRLQVLNIAAFLVFEDPGYGTGLSDDHL